MIPNPNHMVAREYPTHPRVGVGAVVLRGDRVLLVQRGQQPRKGKWSVPGGLVEIGEKLEQAVHRELYEECGIHANIQDHLEIFEYIQQDHDNRIQYHYIVIDYLAEYLEGELRASSDIDQAAWLTFEEIRNLAITDGVIPLVERAFYARDNLMNCS